ncbi:helix-turn-helix domain-containing protein [Paenibacillus sp. p3-SID867]|uniref:helix-turn-helix domain-containing protein n=1 Tax=Paenibacillus sp. p3-SID867 TaxID=2916363 RepID=UPI0021A389CB|nr:helix-turn-helix domain-containing protein [Paenibacillus sp. p3-SID867]MCT1403793.1 helix-turn-helix domain-containing protein [Paenibacillus sp. p3-SID867]
MFNVLLVDDEPWVLEGLRTMIDWNRFGFQICGEALSAPEALKLMEQLKPELVMTDIHMPVLNGLELIEHSKRILPLPPKFVILSGYDDFGYAHQAMRQRVAEYLLKPIDDEEIEAVLAKLSHEIQDELDAERSYRKKAGLAVHYLLNRLIRDELSPDLAEQASKAMQIQGEPLLQCLLIEIGITETGVDWIEWMADYGPPSLLGCFQDNSGSIGVVLHVEHSTPDEVMETALQLQSALARELEGPVIVALSGTGEGIQAIGKLYRQSAEVRDDKRSQGRSGVFCCQEPRGAERLRGLPCGWMDKLLSMIMAGEHASIESCLARIFAAMPDHLLHLRAFQADVADLELKLCRRIAEMNGDPDLFMNRLQRKLGHLSDACHKAPLKNYMRLLAFEAASQLEELSKLNEHNTIFQVIQYVDREYRSRLQLQDLARHFHMNATYLGQLFKKHAGKPFKEYLNDKRIEEAKLLLKRSGMKVSEIALHVGFPNADYFIHKFKLTTGILPSNYKNHVESKQR